MTIYVGDIDLKNSGSAAGSAFSAAFNAGSLEEKKKKKKPLDPNALPDTGTPAVDAPAVDLPEMTA